MIKTLIQNQDMGPRLSNFLFILPSLTFAMPTDVGGVKQRWIPMTSYQYSAMSGEKEQEHMQFFCVAKFGEKYHYAGMIEDRRDEYASQKPRTAGQIVRGLLVDILPGGFALHYAISLTAAARDAIKGASREGALMTTPERPYVAICSQNTDSDSKTAETENKGSSPDASAVGRALYQEPQSGGSSR